MVLVLDIGLLMILTMVVVTVVLAAVVLGVEDYHLSKDYQLQQLLTLDQVEVVVETLIHPLLEIVDLVVLVDQELL